MRAFIDTNVLVYAYAATEDARHEIAARLVDELLAAGTLVVSVQVLKEFIAVSTRKVERPLPLAEAHAIARDLAMLDVVEDTVMLLLEALELQRAHSVSLWDACIVAAAASRGCDVLYTEDMQDGATLLGVPITNPFSSPPSE